MKCNYARLAARTPGFRRGRDCSSGQAAWPQWRGAVARYDFVLPLLVIAALAARQDIVDIRHGRMPARTAMLGWTADGAFVVRHTSCDVQDLSGIPMCAVWLDVSRASKTETHHLFLGEWDTDCMSESPAARPQGCFAISTRDAMRFIRDEQAVLDKVGPLRAGTPITPDVAGGKLFGVDYDDKHGAWRRAAIAVGTPQKWRALRVIWSVDSDKDEYLRSVPAITHVERSPDGELLGIVTSLAHAELDFYWTSERVDVVPGV